MRLLNRERNESRSGKELVMTKTIVNQLRNIAETIEREKISVRLPSPQGTLADENPFVDAACETIEHGGDLESASLASLIHYLADMLEE
jgi:hypothetical protein